MATKIYGLATKTFLLVASWLQNEKVNFEPYFSKSILLSDIWRQRDFDSLLLTLSQKNTRIHFSSGFNGEWQGWGGARGNKKDSELSFSHHSTGSRLFSETVFLVSFHLRSELSNFSSSTLVISPSLLSGSPSPPPPWHLIFISTVLYCDLELRCLKTGQ